ncbi:unnamed protein product [marine sediment metagenome]|uniref:Uncharacterized protein n=1 Tax=marine sediment metagenome TaxID=412755 RepID=X1EIP1_9ZZZZ
MNIGRTRGRGIYLKVANAIADPVAWEQLRKLRDPLTDIDLERMK